MRQLADYYGANLPGAVADFQERAPRLASQALHGGANEMWARKVAALPIACQEDVYSEVGTHRSKAFVDMLREMVGEARGVHDD